jgi:hypothetical protein
LGKGHPITHKVIENQTRGYLFVAASFKASPRASFSLCVCVIRRGKRGAEPACPKDFSLAFGRTRYAPHTPFPSKPSFVKTQAPEELVVAPNWVHTKEEKKILKTK